MKRQRLLNLALAVVFALLCLYQLFGIYYPLSSAEVVGYDAGKLLIAVLFLWLARYFFIRAKRPAQESIPQGKAQ